MKIAELVQSTKKAGSHLLVMENSYALFGHDKTNDMVVVGSHQVKNAHASLYENGKRIEKSHDELLDLFQHLSSLRRTSAVAMFTIYKDDVKRIKESVKSLDATHLRFYSSEHGATVTVFDYRDFDYDRRIGRKNSLKVNYLDIETTKTNDFTFTLNAESFKKLPTADWNFRVGQNGVTEVTPMGESVSYLIRDQKLIEPITIFDSKSTGEQVVFFPFFAEK